MKALAPGFLIAMPQLQDSNFHKSVVLMVEHGPHGSMGLVINREADVTYADLANDQDFDVPPTRAGKHISVGGPVEPYRGFVLHDSTRVTERAEVLPGLFLSVTSDSLAPLLADPEVNVRFCLGYSGWGAGQIEAELAIGSWLFTEASAKTVLHVEPGQIWEQTIKSMGVDPAMLVTTGGMN